LVRSPAEPSILFTTLPEYTEGGSDKLDVIAGRVMNMRAGQSIVIYAKSGEWWIQPLASQPFTAVKPDSTWTTRTHGGSAYAALLVASGYHPRIKADVLPEKGGEILAVAKVETTSPVHRPGKELLFGGYSWRVRQGDGDPGGTSNHYESANAWTDPHGLLHLQIAGNKDRWTSAEVNLARSLGYGTYRFVVRDLSQLEPSGVFSMQVADDSGPAREMDIEISHWGEPTSRNGQFVIQPYHVPANTIQFDTPAGAVTFMLRWTPGRAAFRVYRGVESRWESRAVREHLFTSGIPLSGGESVRFNLYVFGHNSNPLRQGSEVIVESFDYLP
jgi:hypothetical protein